MFQELLIYVDIPFHTDYVLVWLNTKIQKQCKLLYVDVNFLPNAIADFQ